MAMKAFSPAKQPFQTIPAGRLKAACLQFLDRCARGETTDITKHGKVVAQLMPPEPEAEKPFHPLLGRMKGQITIHGDIVGPDFDAWKMRR